MKKDSNLEFFFASFIKQVFSMSKTAGTKKNHSYPEQFTAKRN